MRRRRPRAPLGKIAGKLDAGNALGGGAGGMASPANIGQGSVSTMQAFLGSRILNFKNANYNCMGDELVNTDPKDGKIRWKVKLKGDLAKLGGHLAAAPAAAGGQLFIATVEGEILQVDPEKGGVNQDAQSRLRGPFAARHRKRPNLRRHARRQARLHQHRRRTLHRLVNLGRQHGSHQHRQIGDGVIPNCALDHSHGQKKSSHG